MLFFRYHRGPLLICFLNKIVNMIERLPARLNVANMGKYERRSSTRLPCFTESSVFMFSAELTPSSTLRLKCSLPIDFQWDPLCYEIGISSVDKAIIQWERGSWEPQGGAYATVKLCDLTWGVNTKWHKNDVCSYYCSTLCCLSQSLRSEQPGWQIHQLKRTLCGRSLAVWAQAAAVLWL